MTGGDRDHGGRAPCGWHAGRRRDGPWRRTPRWRFGLAPAAAGCGRRDGRFQIGGERPQHAALRAATVMVAAVMLASAARALSTVVLTTSANPSAATRRSTAGMASPSTKAPTTNSTGKKNRLERNRSAAARTRNPPPPAGFPPPPDRVQMVDAGSSRTRSEVGDETACPRRQRPSRPPLRRGDSPPVATGGTP